MNWRDFPGAPAPGTAIGTPDAGLSSITVGGFPLLVLNDDHGLRGFVNLCPHQFLPLDHRGGTVLSGDGARLVCSSHQATFDAGSGAVTGGPAPCGLTPVPLRLQDGRVVIG